MVCPCLCWQKCAERGMLYVQLLCVGLTAIVHVGPHKTGTSSLQLALEKHRQVLLTRDNFDLVPRRFEGGYGSFEGPKSGANVAICLSRNQAEYEKVAKFNINCTRVLGQFENFLDHARLANRNIILSSEKFDDFQMDIPALVTALRGFETTIVVMHRPYFDWLRSMYTQLRLPMSLEDFASADRILAAGAGRDSSSVAVYSRYKQQFRNVAMRSLANGYINDFVCNLVQADVTCRQLKLAPETHVNANKSSTYFAHTGCMTAGQKELLWTVSVGIEAQARALIGPGLSWLNLAELKDQFAQAPYRSCS